MKLLIAIVCCIVLWVTPTIRGRPLSMEEECRNHNFQERCTADKSGYHTCGLVDNLYNLRTRSLKHVRCDTQPETMCSCYNNWLDNNAECECINPTPRPQFPATGVLRWNGTRTDVERDVERCWWNEDDEPVDDEPVDEERTGIHGEAHKDSLGRYLFKSTEVKGGAFPAVLKTTIEIIIPNGDGTFTKYFRNENSNKCSQKIVKKTGSLTSLWVEERPAQRPARTAFRLVSETRKLNVDTQVWEQYEMPYVKGDFRSGYRKTLRWIVNYDRKGKFAIPSKYYESYDSFYDRKESKIELDYVYESLRKDETSFQLADYCA